MRCPEPTFLWVSRRVSVRNSWLLLGNSTQIGAKIAVLRGAAYPELGLHSAYGYMSLHLKKAFDSTVITIS
jgi:hypothetical protein